MRLSLVRTRTILTRTTRKKPVDVSALRARWCAITNEHGDTKTQRIARRCCWENVARDLERYGRTIRLRMLHALFTAREFADEIEYRLHVQGPQLAASWLEEQLGVRLEVE